MAISTLFLFLVLISGPFHSVLSVSEQRIPIIDLSRFIGEASEESRSKVAKLWNEALETFGFVAIVNHEISESTQTNLFGHALSFFTQTLDQKLRHQHSESYGNGGYTRMGVESVGRTVDMELLPPDLVENFAFLPHTFETLKSEANKSVDITLEPMVENRLSGGTHETTTVEEVQVMSNLVSSASIYWSEAEKLLGTLHELSALALGLENDFFDKYYHQEPSFALRLAYYPPIVSSSVLAKTNKAERSDTASEHTSHQASDSTASGVRYGAHTDYLGFTILRPDREQPGLEVLFPDGKWHDIHSELLTQSSPQTDLSGALIVNVGDLLSQWTNNKWKSAMHRVSNPPVDSKAAMSSRLSLVFFSGPRDDALIEVIPECLKSEKSNGGMDQPKFAPVLSGDFLQQKLKSSNV